MTVLMPESWFIAIMLIPSSTARRSSRSVHSRLSFVPKLGAPCCACKSARIAATSASACSDRGAAGGEGAGARSGRGVRRERRGSSQV